MTPDQIELIVRDAIKEGIKFPYWSYVLFIIISFAASFFGAYFKKKAENSAMKEDIKIITNLVEDIKSNFNERLAKVNSKLNVIANTEITLKNQQNRAIEDFNKHFFDWFDSFSSTIPDECFFDNDLIDQYGDKISSKYSRVLQSEVIFELYIPNPELCNLCTLLRANTYKSLAEQRLKYISAIKMNNIEGEAFKAEIKNNVLAGKSTSDIHKEYEVLLKKRSKHSDEFIKSIAKAFPDLFAEQKEFRTKCKEYLYNLLKEN